MSLLLRANDALSVNPVTGVNEALSAHGSDWLWAVTAIYVISFVSNFKPLDWAHSLVMLVYSPM